jgi:PAS domain S-box-containing protein
MPVSAPDYELGHFFELSSDLLCIAGSDGYLKRLNPSFERVLGYSGEELMSRPFLEFVHPDDVERARDAFVHLATGVDVIGFECRLVCVDGSVRRFEWNTRTVPQLGVLYGIARDVTVRSGLAEEQAARRRVAVLVAQQPSPREVFAAVTEAVGLLLDADLAVLHIFAGDGAATTIASWGVADRMLGIGTRFPLDGDNLAARIFATGAPARMHSDDEAWEREATDLARSLRVRSAVGAPILVEGKLWGALMAATRDVEPWAENAETRIAAFTELVATTIANAGSREALAELADEQAALRRVATLVAQAASPQDLFEAVAEEVGRLLPVGSATMGRFASEAA